MDEYADQGMAVADGPTRTFAEMRGGTTTATATALSSI